MGFSVRSQVAFYTSVFLCCVSFAIVLPSLWPYLHSLSSTEGYYAWVVAFYSIGEAVGAVFFGAQASANATANRNSKPSTRKGMLQTTYCGIVGSLFYILAELFPNIFGLLLVLLGRFAQGLWTGGAQAIQPSYLAAVLATEKITPMIVMINAAASFGFVVGPVFGVLFSWLPPRDLGAGLHFNELTGPGYFVLLCGLFIVVLFMVVFDEEGDRASAEGKGSEKTSSLLEQGKLDRTQCVHDKKYTGASADLMSAAETEPLLPAMDNAAIEKQVPFQNQGAKEGLTLTYGLVVCNFVAFVHFCGFAVQETVTTPLVEKLFGWTVFHATLLFTFGSIFALGAFGGVLLSSSRFSDRGMMLFSIALGAVGYASLIYTEGFALHEHRFVSGFALISIAFPIGRATSMALYTKLLPMEGQGTGQGVLLAVGAVARILGPICAIQALLMEHGGLVVFGVTALLFSICAGVVLLGYSQLKV